MISSAATATVADDRPVNVFTVDLEAYFQVAAFEGLISKDAWASTPTRIREGTDRILELLSASGVQGTFFILGWVAERHPEVVRQIADMGHEVACHGYDHQRVYRQTPEAFREDVTKAKQIIEETSGQPVRGYRAPSFSVVRDSLWALDIIAEAGFAYDSSIFPVVHDLYGIPGAPAGVYALRTRSGARLLELPPSTIGFSRFMVPVAGGGYLRLFPLRFTSWAIERMNRRDRRPAVLYVHPWEFDPEQPRVSAPFKSRFRHYNGLRQMEARVQELLKRFRFAPARDVLEVAAPSEIHQDRLLYRAAKRRA